MTELGYPMSIAVDGKYIYIGELDKIHVYSTENLKHISTFGQKGEGPGELMPFPQKYGLGVALHPDYVLVTSTKKVTYLSRDGKFIKDQKITASSKYFKPLGDYFVGESGARDGNKAFLTVNLFDKQFKSVKDIHRSPVHMGSLNPVNLPSRVYRVTGKHILASGKTEFIIDCYDKNGAKLHAVTHPDFKPGAVGGKDKERFHEACRLMMGNEIYAANKGRIKIPDTYPAIRDFYVDKDKVYVVTWKRVKEKIETLVFDIEANKLLFTTHLPLAEKSANTLYPIAFFNGKLYQLVDNEEEEQYELNIVPVKAE